MTRTSRKLVVILAIAGPVSLVAANFATAAPPAFERWRQYRILDASGRVAPLAVSDASGRVAMRPTYAPPPLLRAKRFYLSGYAGASYAPRRPLNPTSYRVEGRFGPLWHGH
jgi:hypothetical protein